MCFFLTVINDEKHRIANGWRLYDIMYINQQESYTGFNQVDSCWLYIYWLVVEPPL